MANVVYTIGYSGFKINEFIDTLKSRGISLVVDVRSSPYSKYHVDYNKETIERTLKANNIYYRNYKQEFGARQENRNYYPNEYLDFDIFSKSEKFQSGIGKLKNAMKENYTFALMCSEKDPKMCHRTILVARAFHDTGDEVIHLLPDNKQVTQKEIEQALLDQFFPDRYQYQIQIGGPQHSDEEYIALAYKKQNEKIGYTIDLLEGDGE